MRHPVVIVGEAPRQAGLKPFQDGSSRRRLEKLLQVDTLTEKLEDKYQLVNLWNSPYEVGNWMSGKDSVSALISLAKPMTIFVLCGRHVQRAFSIHMLRPARKTPLDKMNFFTAWVEDQALYTYVVIPHPSGRCRWWNDEEKFGEAVEFMRRYR